MPSKTRRDLLSALAGGSAAGLATGLAGCLDSLRPRSGPSPTNPTDWTPSATPGPPHGTFDAYLRGSRGNEDLGTFDSVEAHVASFVFKEVGGKNQCTEPRETDPGQTDPTTDVTKTPTPTPSADVARDTPASTPSPTPTRTPNPTDAETPSPVPRHESMVDIIRFDVDETVDLVAHRQQPALVGRFTIPAVDYWTAVFVIDSAIGRRDGETYELVPEQHDIVAGRTAAQVGETGWTDREMVAPVQVGGADGEDPYLYSFGVFLRDDLPVSPQNDPRIDRGAHFVDGPTAGEDATLKVTEQGEPLGGATVIVDGERYTTNDDGTVSVPVPPEADDRVEKEHCLWVEVLRD